MDGRPEMSMRRASVLVVLAFAGCTFALQPVPKHPEVQATFPAQASAADLPPLFKVATFNIHREPGDKVTKAMLADRNLRDLDLIMLEEVPRWDPSCSGACT